MTEVKCTVDNCIYWAEDNVCSADQILITAGPPAGKDKHGGDAEDLPQTPVPISENTYCWTMTPREALLPEQLEAPAEEVGVPVD